MSPRQPGSPLQHGTLPPGPAAEDSSLPDAQSQKASESLYPGPFSICCGMVGAGALPGWAEGQLPTVFGVMPFPRLYTRMYTHAAHGHAHTCSLSP